MVRLDSIPLDQTYFTEEGYLIDHPIVTTCGVFEYVNEDGSIRRELRLPEHVFAPESLNSYEGKPVIITHDAGKVDKDNVEEEHIGTILSKGYREGNNVRAKIIIHDTEAMKACGLRELSLGYSLTLDETPGEWEGKPYDAIQKDILINHLALVGEARAGEQARLNIDGRHVSAIMKGDDSMNKISTGRPEHRRARLDNEETGETTVPVAAQDAEDTFSAAPQSEPDKVQMVRDRRDRRDQEGDPETPEAAKELIARQDEDIDTLLEVIEELKAKQDFDQADPPIEKKDREEENADEEENTDNCEGKSGAMNADSIDRIVRTRVALARIGDRLHLDGLDRMSIQEAKKAVIRKVKPSMRLDGKGKSYINAAFDLAVGELDVKKGAAYQRSQMFNGDGRNLPSGKTSAEQARNKMIARRNGGSAL